LARKTSEADETAELGRQAAKSRRTQEAIINAVIELITEGGYAAASSTRIARQAGVSWGAVQHHFGGKEQILEAVLARSHETFYSKLSDERFTRGSLERRIDQFVETAWEHYQGAEYTAALEILLASRGHDGGNGGQEVRLNHESHLHLWRSIFHDVKISDLRMQEAIYMVHCTLTGILIETILEPSTFDEQRYLRLLKRVVKGMLTA